LHRRYRVLFGLTYPIGLASILYAVWQPRPTRLADAAVFFFLAYLSDWLPIRLPLGGSTSVSFATYMSALLLFGPTVPIVAALAGGFHHLEIQRGKPLQWMLFDAAQLLASVAVMSLAFVAAGGRFLAVGQAISPLTIRDAAAALLGAALFFCVNTGLVTVAVSIRSEERPARVWADNFRWLVGNYIILALVGILMAGTYVAAGTAGVLLLIAPLQIARQAFVMYMRRREAYYQTVHSLVASIEAKDPYTRGHSERVARYAELAAEELDLNSEDAEMQRFAALLHDLGKIGIARNILNKPEGLSPEEFGVVQQHPEIAARILRRIGFLERAVPGVLAHHERLDGTGYCQASVGSDIPLFARILAVADGFDAMTSERPYRAALTTEEAVGELLKHSGTQFDGAVVAAFLKAMRLDRLPSASRDGEGQLRLLEAAD
jgi:putative nucleotidyltransferase with HDIG domain